MGKLNFDALNIVLLVLSIALVLTGNVSLYFLAGGFFFFFAFRLVSRDTYSRQRENAAFCGFFINLKNRLFGPRAPRAYQAKPTPAPKDPTKKVFKCPNCKQKLRVPKGKGKIMITCTYCGHKFQKRT